VHGLLAAHVIPAVHALQRPAPSHTPPGQLDPAGRSPLGAHTGAPVTHEIIPVVHALPVLQLVPAAHATHVPIPSHTPPAHGAPAARAAAPWHTGAPEAQDTVPTRHSSDGAHVAPSSHGTHAPRPSHTPPAHGAPAGALACVTHVGESCWQLIAPVRQASTGVHDAPSSHAKHRPAALHAERAGHAPHEPPQRSSPHSRSAHTGAHASTRSAATSAAASSRTPPSGTGIGCTSSVVHCPSSPHVCPRSSQKRAMVHGALSSLHRAGALTIAAHAAGTNSRTNDGVLGTSLNRADRPTMDTGCPGAAGASCSVASTTTVESGALLPGTTVNDVGNRKSSAAPVLVHARGCALPEGVAPDETRTRSESTRSRASVSTITSTDVGGLVHDASAQKVSGVAARAHRRQRFCTVTNANTALRSRRWRERTSCVVHAAALRSIEESTVSWGCAARALLDAVPVRWCSALGGLLRAMASGLAQVVFVARRRTARARGLRRPSRAVASRPCRRARPAFVRGRRAARTGRRTPVQRRSRESVATAPMRSARSRG
jgi:hypothetical protein